MEPQAAAIEVRRCAKCNEAAVVKVFEWSHSYSGLKTGASTRDYRCQTCGARFSLHPRVTDITFIVMGLVMSCAIFPLGFTIFGWLRLRRDKANPIVPGAPRPVLRYRDGPPLRRCVTCGQEVALKGVTRHRHNGVPTGTEYEYHCLKCDKPFVIESVWGHCVSGLATSLVAGISAAFFLGASSPGWKYGGGIVATLIVVFLVAQNAGRVMNRFKYPVVEGRLPELG